MNREEKIAHIREQKYFVRGDIAVFAVLLALIALFTLLAFYVPRDAGDSFSVIWRGEEIFSAPLDKDACYVFLADEGAVFDYDGNTAYENYNLIEVRGGLVSVTEADCSDHTCVSFPATDWQDIICLPHEMRIRPHGGGGMQTDV